MQEQLIGQLRMSRGTIEVRRYAWSEPELITFRRPDYMLSRLLACPRGRRPIGWRLPSSNRAVRATQMSVLPPESPTSVAFEAGEAEIVSCILAPDYFEEITGIADWKEEHTLLCFGLRSPLIGLIFNRLAHEVLHARQGSELTAETFVGALAVEVARGIEREVNVRPIGQLAPWQLQQILSLVEDESPEHRPTIEQIADRLGISPRHLMRGFKASTGLTLHQYANEVRMRRAMEALREGRFPLKVLAARLGFSSPSAFSAAFRQTVGCTPSDYRDRARFH